MIHCVQPFGVTRQTATGAAKEMAAPTATALTAEAATEATASEGTAQIASAALILGAEAALATGATVEAARRRATTEAAVAADGERGTPGGGDGGISIAEDKPARSRRILVHVRYRIAHGSEYRNHARWMTSDNTSTELYAHVEATLGMGELVLRRRVPLESTRRTQTVRERGDGAQR
jgi:hypothetical protein